MAMLHALRAAGRWSVGVATVDHGLHARASAHASWVMQAARSLGVEAWRLVADRAVIESGAGVEDGARRARYAALEAQAQAWGAGALVVAHTADDQAETLLMRLGEGTGLRGLGGMRARRGQVARPWLGVSRAAVAAFADAAGVEWIEDPTNEDERFRRNALRASVMPGMAAVLGAGWVERASAAAGRLAGAEALIDWCLTTHGWVVEEQGAVEVRRSMLAEMPAEARGVVVARALSRAAARWAPGVGRRVALHVERVMAQVDAGAVIALPGGLEARWTTSALRFEPTAAAGDAPPPMVIDGPGRWAWGRRRVRVARVAARPSAPQGDYLSCAAAPMPWVLRVARPGDRFQALGAPGRRAVTRAWRDAGVPVADRRVLPVVESGGRLVWAGGLRAAEHVRVGAGEPAWQIELVEAGDEGAEGEVERDGSHRG